MKYKSQINYIILLAVLFFPLSCKKAPLSNAGQINNTTAFISAGDDQTIVLPTDSVFLNGSVIDISEASIKSWLWQQVEGPAGYQIVHPDRKQTWVRNLSAGNYKFKFTIVDAKGKVMIDTSIVLVLRVNHSNCAIGDRPTVKATLTSVGKLSMARGNMSVVATGNNIFFAGGAVTSTVDVYDISTNAWSVLQLSQARSNMAVTTLKNKVYFAGGSLSGVANSFRVDIYDLTNRTWSTAELSKARTGMSAAAAGNKVVFAGGFNFFGPGFSEPPVDILDITTNSWSVEKLKHRSTEEVMGDAGISATVIDDNIYLAGNASDWLAWDFGSISSTINIYNTTTNSWSVSAMAQPRGYMAAIAVGDNNYWAGGINEQPQTDHGPFTSQVEIRNMKTGETRFECLFQPNGFFDAVVQQNKIIFFTTGYNNSVNYPDCPRITDKFDIYDISFKTWTIAELPFKIYNASIISVNNTVYVAGGYISGALSDQVWKLEF